MIRRRPGPSGGEAGSSGFMSIHSGSHSFCCSCCRGSAMRSAASQTTLRTKSCTISRSPHSPTTSPRLVSGSSRFRTGRASSSPSRRWCGSPCTFDSGGRPNPNRCTHRMPRRGIENPWWIHRASRRADDLGLGWRGGLGNCRCRAHDQRDVGGLWDRAYKPRRRERSRWWISARFGFRTVVAAKRCSDTSGRGYQYSAVTDHSYGLKIDGGMESSRAAAWAFPVA